MTRICEQVFSVELPGQWERIESEEPGSLVYHETEGPGVLTVMLLSVRPIFAIADKARVLSDYVSHRMKYELGRTPSLEQSEPVSEATGESFEASWRGADVAAGWRQQHRVVLLDNVLADFCFESVGLDEAPFHEQAQLALASANVSAEDADTGV